MNPATLLASKLSSISLNALLLQDHTANLNLWTLGDLCDLEDFEKKLNLIAERIKRQAPVSEANQTTPNQTAA
jgi:hypothetical protein